MKTKIFKASLFIIIATICYYFIIASFTPKASKMPEPVPDIEAPSSGIHSYSVEPKRKIIITVDDDKEGAFDFLNWLIASALGMVTYAGKKGIDFGFTVLEGRIRNRK